MKCKEAHDFWIKYRLSAHTAVGRWRAVEERQRQGGNVYNSISIQGDEPNENLVSVGHAINSYTNW